MTGPFIVPVSAVVQTIYFDSLEIREVLGRQELLVLWRLRPGHRLHCRRVRETVPARRSPQYIALPRRRRAPPTTLALLRRSRAPPTTLVRRQRACAHCGRVDGAHAIKPSPRLPRKSLEKSGKHVFNLEAGLFHRGLIPDETWRLIGSNAQVYNFQNRIRGQVNRHCVRAV